MWNHSSFRPPTSRRRAGEALFLAAVLIGVALGATTVQGVGRSPGGVTERESQPVLLELFTSQGCSSCPPADHLLGELGQRPNVIPLAFHVDYWNHLGWKDPFSSARWSDRQRSYAGWLEEETIYTPQLVVDGRAHVVGSDRAAVDRELETSHSGDRASESPTIHVRTRHRPDRIDVEVSFGGAVPSRARLRIALYERHLEIPISRGENSGRTLAYDYVVRDLRSLDQQGGGSSATSFDIQPGWKAADLGVVAFLQDDDTGAVLAVSRTLAPSSVTP